MAWRKPNKQRIGGKFLVYGETGSGKSQFGLTFPKIAAIDAETGLSFYEGTDIEIDGKKYNNLVAVDTTSDLESLEENLTSIIDGDVEGIETLLIDSETKFYVAMDIACTEVEERKAKLKGKDVDTRAKWGRVKNITMKMQQAKLTASAKGYNVVSTAQSKEILEENTNKLLGYKPDAHKSLAYDYDTILRFFTEVDKKSKQIKYYAEVLKDRTNVTKVGQVIENCTYDIWKPYFEARNNFESSTANFSNDLKTSTNATLANAELQTKLADDIKAKLKDLTPDGKRAAKDKFDELYIDLKHLDLTDLDKLKEVVKFLDTL